MSKNYIYAAECLALSNGLYTPEEGDHLCLFEHKPRFYTNAIRRSAVILTDHMVGDPQDPEQVLNVLDKIRNILSNYGTKDLVEKLEVRLHQSIKELQRRKAYKAKVAELDKLYPQISQELRVKVKYFDMYYHYSDDNRVYNAGLKAEEALKKELALVSGGAEYAKAFFAITY